MMVAEVCGTVLWARRPIADYWSLSDICWSLLVASQATTFDGVTSFIDEEKRLQPTSSEGASEVTTLNGVIRFSAE